MMEMFNVEVDEPSPLYEMRRIRDPHTDEYLIHFSRVRKSTLVTHTIDFRGGELVIGLDQEHTITFVLIDRPKRMWKKLDPKVGRPTSARKGTIRLPAIQARHNDYDDVPVQVQSDEAKSFALIAFDAVLETQPVIEWVEIAPQCLAMVSGAQLHGFWVDLSK